jgi:cell wall-associated NlpC family hydrolase
MSPSSETAARAVVVAAARRWIGTPYHPCADLLGVGVDCGMLIVRVFVDCGLVRAFDPRPYPQDWHLHRSEEKYLGFVRARCVETQSPRPGDLALFRWGRCYSHGGIVTRADPLTIVHAFQPAGLTIEEPVARNARLTEPAREPRFFSLWGKGAAP